MKTILKLEDVKVYFNVKKGLFKTGKSVKAVDGVTLQIYENECFGLVGESGCGKSTLGRTIVKIYNPTSGSIYFNDTNINNLNVTKTKSFKKDVQMIFQDPYASLNPRMTVGEIIKEPMVIHKLYTTKQEQDEKVQELLQLVGLKLDHIHRYPHEFSGGQRQRISIARTLALNPKFIVCDEPISALDVSIQAQIINLLQDIKEKMGISYLFIAHDLGAVKHISDRIGAMYLGNLVEVGPAEDLYNNPLHPYTKALISAIPVPDPNVMRVKENIKLESDIPSPLDTPSGCPFRTRCEYATEQCVKDKPTLKNVGNRQVACHLY